MKWAVEERLEKALGMLEALVSKGQMPVVSQKELASLLEGCLEWIQQERQRQEQAMRAPASPPSIFPSPDPWGLETCTWLIQDDSSHRMLI